MADIRIGIEADYSNFISGNNKVVAGVSSLRKELIQTRQGADKYTQAIERELNAIQKDGDSLDALKKSYKLLSTEAAYLSQALGKNNETFKNVARQAQNYALAIEATQRANRKAREAQENALAKAEALAKIETQNERELQRLIEETNAEFRQRQLLIDQLNAKNADLGFMVLTGDKVGVANYTLKEYEKTLKQVIADTGLNSEETQKALAAYQKQAKYVSILNDSTKKLNASTQGYNTTKKQTIRVEESHSNKLLSVAKNILKFQLLMGPITSAIRGIKQFVSESTVAAAEAEQTFSKLATVFNTVSDSATKMAESLAQTIGVSKSTAASALSTVGDLLQAQGMGTSQSLSTASTWVSQFQDIIAFKDINMSLEEFAQNFMSGAAGNLRNFRTFGSIVKESAVNARLASQGLDKLTGSELELAKMTTRAEIALEQQANAMGATKREWDTMLSVNRRMAEAQKELKENFGSWLNTALKPIKTVWTEILDTINDAVAASRQLPQFAQNMASATPSILFSRSENADLWERNSRGLVGGFANYFGMMSEEKDLGKIYDYDATLTDTAQQIAKMFVSFGLTVEEGLSAFEEDWQTVQALEDDYFGDIDIRAELQKRVREFTQWVDDALGSEGNTNSLTEAIDRISNVYESLAAIAGVSVDSSLGSFNRHSGKLSGDTQSAFEFSMMQLQGNLQLGFKEALDSISAADWETFFTRSQMDFGEGTELGGLSAKTESLKAIYAVIQNATDLDEKKREEYLTRVVEIYGDILDRQQEINDEIERQSQLTSALSAISTSGSNYGVQLAQLRKSDDDKALDNLRRQYDAAYALAVTADEQKQVNDAYEDARNVLLSLLAEQKKYNTELEREKGLKAANDKITEARKTGARAAYERQQTGNSWDIAYNMEMWDINNDVFDFIRELTASGYTFKEATDKAKEYREVLEANAEATRKAAKAEAEAAAWKALGDRALGSTGTMGQVIQSFRGEGDIWTKILNALLTILENTEGWERVAALLDQVFKAFEPVIDAIVDVIAALPWDIIIFCVKIIASAIVVILKAVEYIVNMFVWLWDNLKAAIHNIIEFIKHPANARKRDTWEYRSWENLQQTLDDTAQKEYEILERIWATSNEIAENTSKDDLSLLRDLYARNIINEDQFYAGARVVQKNMVFDPVAATSPNYISASQPSMSSVSYGGVTIQFSGTNTEEMKRWITDFFNRNGLSYNMEIGG